MVRIHWEDEPELSDAAKIRELVRDLDTAHQRIQELQLALDLLKDAREI